MKFLFRIYLFFTQRILRTRVDYTDAKRSFAKLINKIKSYSFYNINGFKFKYETDSDVGVCLLLDGEFEKFEIETSLKYLKKDSIVLDIGANIGFHTIYFAQCAKDGMVITFEPSKKTFSRLVENTKGFENIVNLNLAVSDNTCITEFVNAEDCAYSGLQDTGRKKVIGIEKVLCLKGDDLLEKLNLPKVDFIKIDVEGFEEQVIKGLFNTISKYKPIMLVEIFSVGGLNQDPDKIILSLIETGYEAFVVNANTLVKYEKHDNNFYNYFFIPNDFQL